MIFGLTGGIASGKSLVSQMLARHGVHVVDADLVSREVTLPDRPAYMAIVGTFGHSIIRNDGTLNRKKLGQIVFADTEARRRLEAIVLPYIKERASDRLRVANEVFPLVCFDAPTLVENGMADQYRPLVVVRASVETQTMRLIARDGLTLNEVNERIRSQFPTEQRVAVADYIIDNDQGESELLISVGKCLTWLRERATPVNQAPTAWQHLLGDTSEDEA